MLLLSRVTGHDVLGPDGRAAGRVADLTVRLGAPAGPHLVERILVRDGAAELLIPWTAVESVRHTDIALVSDDVSQFASPQTSSATTRSCSDATCSTPRSLTSSATDSHGSPMWCWPARDHRLELVGVEVGFAGVLRRLGLHRLAARAGEDAVAWTDLHLTSERGHAVQLATPRSAVHHLDARGLAALVSRLDTESAAEVLAVKGPDVAADVVRAAHPVVGERVLRAMPDAHVAQIVAAMPAEHATHWRRRLAQRSRTTVPAVAGLAASPPPPAASGGTR